MPVDPEADVAQHLGTKPIAQTDIFKPDHAVPPKQQGDNTTPAYEGRYGFQFVNGWGPNVAAKR